MEPNQYIIFLEYLSSALLGILLSFSELLSRYRSSTLIMKSKNAWVYMLINGAASLIAIYFINTGTISFGEFTKNSAGKVLTAGLSAMFILRSSFFSFKDKDSDKTINVGLSAILSVFLDSAERAFDQKQSIIRLKDIRDVMKDIDFDKAAGDLTVLCLSLMVNVSQDEQTKLNESIQKLKTGALQFDETKSITLGILISRITGIPLLKEAVSTLGVNIKEDPESDKNIFSNLAVEKQGLE